MEQDQTLFEGRILSFDEEDSGWAVDEDDFAVALMLGSLGEDGGLESLLWQPSDVSKTPPPLRSVVDTFRGMLDLLE